MKTYCNPLDLSYKYQHPLRKPYAYKEAADPTLICFKGKYLLFVSMCGGFYYSDDLVSWDYHEDKALEIYSYAPDVAECGGYLYFCASERTKKSKILRTQDPFCGFELVSKPFAFWDPHLYFEDGRAYLYWGCSSRKPIFGIELDQKTMMPVGKKKPLVFGDGTRHGIDDKTIYLSEHPSLQEKFINLVIGTGPYIEGAFLNKIGKTYYFQYSTPGTEFPTYGDAVCVGESPLGPFSFQRHNPYSVVPEGFLQGAGHGSTFFDKFGNLWHASTVGVCVNHAYERRIGLWPAGVDRDGILFCNQYFADYPKTIPEGKFDPLTVKPDAMLLSFGKRVKASSSAPGCPPERAVDESIKTVWASQSGSPGEWIEADLGHECSITGVQVNFGDHCTPKWRVRAGDCGGAFTIERKIDTAEHTFGYTVEIVSENGSRQTLGTFDTPLSHHYIPTEARGRYVRVTFDHAPYGQSFAVSGLRVFGHGGGERPPQCRGMRAKRVNATTGECVWDELPQATGYCIRLGIAPDKLYNSVLLYGRTSYTVPFLNEEVPVYYYAVDSFNENGITEGTVERF